MAKLYFYYGAMGSSKSANALMAEYNYRERGQKTLLAKTNIDTRDGVNTIRSRIGLERECVLLSEVCRMKDEELKTFDAIIVDEIQFAKTEECNFLARVVDELNVPVMTYGLRTDFQLHFFEGSMRMMELADEIKEVKTVCWCGKKATFNARFDENGIIKHGKQVVLGANEKYTSLCRKHWREGNLGDKK